MAFVNLGQVVWPVGAIYMSSSSVSPASLFGGTWEQFTDSKMWLPQNNYGATGGEGNHVLTVEELPKHSHPLYPDNNPTFWKYGIDWGGGYAWSAYSTPSHVTKPIDLGSTGGSAAHNNMPPYRTCYCWRRKS